MYRTVMIAGTHSGAGKTTVSLGLMGFLSKRYKVQPFKVGPDYIDTAYHRHVTGNYSCNLDLYMLGEEKLKSAFLKNAVNADISIIEGVMGMYDGIDATSKGSSADIAKILRIPVILVVDASSMATSVSALIMGYMHYDRNVNIAGVILNRVGSEKHYILLKECIERDLNIDVLGYLPNDAKLNLSERHLGLVPVYEMPSLKDKLEKLYEYIEKYIDIKKIIDIANISGTDDFGVYEGDFYKFKKIKIAYAYDEAFNFYYKDGLELFIKMGAELVPFSPLNDIKLPDGISGIYIGGGFPEVFAQKLTKNERMQSSIKNAIVSGMPVYAECGGLMYLAKNITDLDGNTFKMVGVYDASIVMTKKLQRFGYVEAEVFSDNVLFKKGDKVRGHEFHHSKMTLFKQKASYIVHKPGKSEAWECGYVYKNCLATYVHINLYTYPETVKRFIEKCCEYKNNK